MEKRIAMFMRKSPYGTVYPAEGFRAMMGIAVFEMDLCVIFVDDGVFTLVDGQCPEDIDMKSLGVGFASLPDVGITEFYVHDESLKERGLSTQDLVMDVKVVNNGELHELLDGCTAVLPF